MGRPSMRSFYSIWFGQSISCIGSSLTAFCLKIWIFQHSSSLTVSALTTVFNEIPAIILAPLAGLVADKRDRRAVMLWSDTIAALASIFIAWKVLHNDLLPWHIYVATSFQSCCRAFQWPAFSASISLLVPPDGLDRANGLREFSDGISQLIVPALAGTLLSVFGLRYILAFDLISFVCGVLPLLVLVRTFPVPPISAEGLRMKGKGIWAESTAAWRFVRTEHPELMWVLVLHTGANLVETYLAELIPPLLLRIATVQQMGFVISFAGIGALVGSVVVTLIGTPQRKVLTITLCLCLQGLLMFGAAMELSVWAVAILGFLILFADPFINTSSALIWQTRVPADIQGRVFALTGMISASSLPLGALTAGPIIDMLCEPLMAKGGPLEHTLIGTLVGSGGGRGISLWFIFLGVLMTLMAVLVYLFSSVSRLDTQPRSEGKTTKKDH